MTIAECLCVRNRYASADALLLNLRIDIYGVYDKTGRAGYSPIIGRGSEGPAPGDIGLSLEGAKTLM
ncbi:MAG: hypothetical protein QOH29_700, partial [Actinomycetota bacterium]|nr:hypothetical protein [Actinomycetota bacterium]